MIVVSFLVHDVRLQAYPVVGIQSQDGRDAVGFLVADVVIDGRGTQRVARKVVIPFTVALVVAQGDGKPRRVSQGAAAVYFRSKMVAFTVLCADFSGKLIARLFQHIVDRAGQGGTAIQGALRALHHFHTFQGGHGNAGVAFLDNDAIDEQAGIGAAENIGLAPYHRTEVIPAESLGKIETRRVVGDILQGSDTPFLQRRFGKRAHRQRDILEVFLAFPCGNDNLFYGVLAV